MLERHIPLEQKIVEKLIQEFGKKRVDPGSYQAITKPFNRQDKPSYFSGLFLIDPFFGKSQQKLHMFDFMEHVFLILSCTRAEVRKPNVLSNF